MYEQTGSACNSCTVDVCPGRRHRLIAKRRQLPITEVDREYRFIGPDGETDLL